MATLKKMREEISTAYQQGYNYRIRALSGIEDSPKDATEVFILYLALEAVRGKKYAPEACQALKKWAQEENDGIHKHHEEENKEVP